VIAGAVTNTAAASAGGVTSTTDSVSVYMIDYGDLPAAYHLSLKTDDGARNTFGNLWLGTSKSAEADGQENAAANLDTYDDGVTRNDTNWNDGTGSVQVTVTGGRGCLMGWLDYRGASAPPPYTPDDDFNDPGEVIINNQPVNTGNQTFSITLPPNAATNAAWYTRFRLAPDQDNDGDCSDQTAVGLTGLVTNGETEDYHWAFGPTPVTLSTLTVRQVTTAPAFGALALAVLALVIGAGWRIYCLRKIYLTK
jgi:hypothetical protein